MKHILVIFIFDKQGKIYLTNINEHQKRTVFHKHITESDTCDIDNIIKYDLNIKIDLKYKESRLYDIGIGESKEKEYKYYLYCYRIKKYNKDSIFGKETVELKDMYKKYDELHDKVIKIVYDKIHDVTRMIARNSYLVKRIKSSWKPGNIGPFYYDPMKFGFHPKSDISRYYNDIVCSRGFKYDELKEFTLEIVDKINIDKKKDESNKFYKKRVRKDNVKKESDKKMKVHNNSRINDYFKL
jgi:hypothetical protein